MRLQVTLQKHEFKRKFLTEGRQFHLHVSCGSRHSLWYTSKCNLFIILTQISVAKLIMLGTTKLLHAPVMRWLALQSIPLPGNKSWRVPWLCYEVINHWLDYWSPILLYKVRMACEVHIHIILRIWISGIHNIGLFDRNLQTAVTSAFLKICNLSRFWY